MSRYIKHFNFDGSLRQSLPQEFRFARNWPVVYTLFDHKDKLKKIYIGKSQDIHRRIGDHLKNKEKNQLTLICIITAEDFHSSATEDIESSLIQYFAGHEPRFILLNKNSGLVNPDYFNRQYYQAKLPSIWNELKQAGIVEQNIPEIENNALFKYSPYKSLTEEQQEIAEAIVSDLKDPTKPNQTHLVSGPPGTGKTVLASYLLKRLFDESGEQKMKAALVIPNRRFLHTIQEIIGGLPGFTKKMVKTPYEITHSPEQKRYDLLIVDETHLLGSPKGNQAQIGDFRRASASIGLNPKQATQLDWVIQRSNHRILFYDEQQSIRSSNIEPQHIQSLNVDYYHLNKQQRVRGGQAYIDYITKILNDHDPQPRSFNNYQFKLHNNIDHFISDLQAKENEFGLSRILAGWSWPWKMTDPEDKRQININGSQLRYQPYQDTRNIVDSSKGLSDVSYYVHSIHTIQGHDLNYAGVIIGPDLDYDPVTRRTFVIKENYHDTKGKSLASQAELEEYIKRIYRILLTRAIHGTSIYICNPNLRQHWQQFVLN